MQKLKFDLNRLTAAVLLLGLIVGISGFLFTGRASATQLTTRSLTISTAVTNATSVGYTFGFTLATTGAVQGMKFQACTTALNTCTAPTGLSFSSRTFTSQSGWVQTGNFAVDATGANDCVPAANIICVNRTQATNETSGTAVTIAFGGITNPSGASCSTGNTQNCTFFVRITTYSTTTYTVASTLDTGTVASSTTQTLTIYAAIQEQLQFCVGSTNIDNATAVINATTGCAGVSGTNVNLGTLSSGTVTITPVGTSTGGNNLNGVAMLQTNAVNGTAVYYRAVQQSGTNHLGTLRVLGASCDAASPSTSNTDQCFNIPASQSTFTAGTEDFGMTVAGTNCGETAAYSCTFASGTNNLKASTGYIGATATTYGTSTGFLWKDDGTTSQIAASTTAVDNEALILKFAATPNIVTPTGSYQAQGDFIAVPKF